MVLSVSNPNVHPAICRCDRRSHEEQLQVVHTNVAALDGSLGSTESQTNVLVPSPALSNALALCLGLGVEEDVRLLLERTFRLDGQLGRHFRENSVRH